MSRPDTIIIDGRAYSWRRIMEVRRRQLEAWKAAQGAQATLFPLMVDRRPVAERTVAGRYTEPSLIDWLRNDGRE